MSELEIRIQKLESESEIRKLKARYLNACDTKNVELMRDCFTSDAEIQFPPLGNFDLEGLIKIFQEVAATTPISDIHHGHNGEIEIQGSTANGRWNLGFATYDPRTKNFRMMSSIYEDRYRKTDNGWRICFTKSTPRTIIDGILKDEGLTINWNENI